MKRFRTLFSLALAACVILGGADPAQAQMNKLKKTKMSHDRAAEDFPRIDANGDGGLDRAEWKRRGNFARLDANGDGALSLDEFRILYAGQGDKDYDGQPVGPRGVDGTNDPGALAARVGRDALDKETLCAIGRSRKCDTGPSQKRGMIETGLGPEFPRGANCPGIDDYWAMDYGFKRSREAFHGGIDMPVPWGTPMIAAAAGTVVGKFVGEDSARGTEIVLRHSPQDTGLPMWIYTAYGHMDALPDLAVGQRVGLGEYLGPTGNSGVSGKTREPSGLRRPAIHFSVMYAASGAYAEVNDIIIPVDGAWMDPVALYRQAPPFESASLRALPDAQKSVPIAVMFEDGSLSPEGSKRIWPYACTRD